MKLKLLPALLLAAALLFCACAGAHQGGSTAPEPGGEATPGGETLLDPQNPISLALWHYYVGENQLALENAVAQFNQTIGIEKGVVVEAIARGSIAELEEAVTSSAMGIINADPMPDIFSSYPAKAMEIDALGMVCDLNGYFTEAEKQQYVPGFLADGLYDGGRFLLVPIVKSTELLYVNATAWQAFATANSLENSALETWEGAYETARAHYQWLDAQSPDTPWDGKGLLGFDSVANFIIIGNKQMGIDVIDAAGQQALLDKAALRRLFDIYCGGTALGYFDAVGKFRSDDIKAGDLVAYVGSSSSAAYFPTWIVQDNTQLNINFLALPYPTFRDGEAYAIQQGAGMCVANSTPQKQEGAALFLKWFTQPAQNIDFAMTTGYLPVQTDAYQSEAFQAVLTQLRQGEAAQQNVAAVYEIALHQITEASTYAAKPFAGSYDVRSILQATLLDAGSEAKAQAEGLKAQGLPEEDILQALDLQARFEAWLSDITARLDSKEIAYTLR